MSQTIRIYQNTDGLLSRNYNETVGKIFLQAIHADCILSMQENVHFVGYISGAMLLCCNDKIMQNTYNYPSTVSLKKLGY